MISQRLLPLHLKKWQRRYTYSPVDSNAGEIRLLTLLPGVFSAPIRIILETHTLTEEDHPVYEALSYVWGATDDPITINVGRQGNNSLAVTQNLGSALQHLRSVDKLRIFWIDAICVNQQDLGERSQQGEKMSSIFRLADRVVAWLGNEKDDSTHALGLLAFIGSQIEVDWIRLAMTPAGHSDVDAYWADVKTSWSVGEKSAMALYSILHRSWFERVWIRQEIQLANKDAVLQCGFKFILWETFRYAMFCVRFKPKDFPLTKYELVSLDARISLVFRLCDLRTPELSVTLQDARFGKCSDPRDKVYAVMSLANGGLNMKPDYTKSTAEVYNDLARRCIAHYGSFHVLRYCEPHFQLTELPSWIPDWSATTIAKPLAGPAWASGWSYAYDPHEKDDILETCGVQVGTVEHVEEILFGTEDGSRTRSEDLKEIRRLAQPKFMPEEYIGGGSGLDVFCSTLYSGAFSDAFEPPIEFIPTFEESKEAIGAWLNNEQIEDTFPGNPADVYLSKIRFHSRNRSLIYCEDGYIGLSPRYTLPGDVVCVIFGCAYPLILRLAKGCQFQLVGACYIHGFMHNEVFLGPLASNFQAVYIYEPSSCGDCPGYRNLETGDISEEDPRLTPEEHKAWRTLGFARDIFLSASDPTLTPESFKKRGIKPQIFELI